MLWLNNSCPLTINITNEHPRVIENATILSDQFEKDFYFKCESIFNQINRKENPITSEEGSNKYAELFKEKNDKEFSFSLCFLLLSICNSQINNKNCREKLLEILKIMEPPKKIHPQLLYFLALKNSEFETRFGQLGGTEPALKLLLQIHTTKNIEWWLQELLLYSTSLNASDFDKELISSIVLNNTIDCGNFLQTMIITLYYHILVITKESICDYAEENISHKNAAEDFIYNIMTSSSYGYLKEAYAVSQSSLFSVHILNLFLKEARYLKEYHNAVIRYVEFLSSDVELRPLIPSYLSTIAEKEMTVPKIIQNVLPAIVNNMPKCIIDQVSELESFEKEYSLKSIRKLREWAKNSKSNTQNYNSEHAEKSDENDVDIADFLNECFVDSNKKVKRDIMKVVVDFEKDGNQSNKLQKLENVKGSVYVGMIESYLDAENRTKEREFLNQSLFDYIAENGDIPEYGE